MRGGAVQSFGGLADKLVVSNCTGTVIFEDFGTMHHVRVQRCEAVAFTGCGLPMTTIEDSRVAFSGTTVLGQSCSSTLACAAIIAKRSSVSIAGGRIQGGDPAVFLFPASPAIHVDGSDVTIAGQATAILGGNGPVPAISSTSGQIHLGPGVTMTANGAQAITGNAVVTRRHIPSIAAAGVLAGQTFLASTHSEVGSSTHTLANLPGTPVPTPFGTLWLAAPSLVLDSGVTPQSGLRQVSFPLPPVIRGLPLVIQPIATLTSGQLVVGTPTSIVLN